MDPSEMEKLLYDDPTHYPDSCGVMDTHTAVCNLDQQIILNDMILAANGVMPYPFQQSDPSLQQNNPPPLMVCKRLPPPKARSSPLQAANMCSVSAKRQSEV